ncbi:selenoprotein domain protein [Apiospora phragmitis]|uniref:Selenoprotein domain protein n=1 Tax=Apiospora phragmitis TaxID=2905665 RepID=A0ABR1TRL3_9PEZI
MAEITTSSSAPASGPAPSASAASVSASASGSSRHLSNPVLPRVTIRFCTQCKWMLRAAYYAQELLSTFSTGLGEVALQPSTGGTFIVEILAAVTTPTSGNDDENNAQQQQGGAAAAAATSVAATTQHRVLWDRTVDGGFPETKELKRRVRDVIEPNRDLGHVDRDHARKAEPAAAAAPVPAPAPVPAAPQESILTSSSSSTPTVVRDTPRQGQSHPRMPVKEADPPASTAPGNVDGKGAGAAVCEDCQ